MPVCAARHHQRDAPADARPAEHEVDDEHAARVVAAEHGDDRREDSKRLPIEETAIFEVFESCADWIWDQVSAWDWKAQKTIGIQLIRAVDSINANLVEGDGRYSSADSINFFIIARASARETRLWLRRAIQRNLVPEAEGRDRINQINSGAKQLNLLISLRRGNKKNLGVREAIPDYLFPEKP